MCLSSTISSTPVPGVSTQYEALTTLVHLIQQQLAKPASGWVGMGDGGSRSFAQMSANDLEYRKTKLLTCNNTNNTTEYYKHSRYIRADSRDPASLAPTQDSKLRRGLVTRGIVPPSDEAQAMRRAADYTFRCPNGTVDVESNSCPGGKCQGC